MHVLVNSGADSVSHNVSPNQNVGRSWKFHVAPPAPDAFGWVFGSFGRVIRIGHVVARTGDGRT